MPAIALLWNGIFLCGATCGGASFSQPQAALRSHRLIAAAAQTPARTRRVAVLMLYAESDLQGQARAVAFRQGLESAGWVAGRNIAVDYLWGTFSPDGRAPSPRNLGRLTPDVIVVNSGTALRAVQSMAASTPIVFIGVSEPVAQGFAPPVLSHPGGNMTGSSDPLSQRLARSGSTCLSRSRRRSGASRSCTIWTIPAPGQVLRRRSR